LIEVINPASAPTPVRTTGFNATDVPETNLHHFFDLEILDASAAAEAQDRVLGLDAE